MVEVVLVADPAGTCPGDLARLRALLASSGVPAEVRVRHDGKGDPLRVEVDGHRVEPLTEGRFLAALGAAAAPASADRWDAMLVHGPQPVVPELAADDGTRPRRFTAHRDRIVTALGARARLVEHIGSTAVPGLVAKPVTDVVVGIDDPDDEGAYLPDLLAAGYELRVVEPGHRCLRDVTGEPANVHCYAPADPEVAHYLLLRDHLRAHPEAVRTYADAKRALAGREWPDMNAYADAKGPAVRVLLAEARLVARGQESRRR